MLHIAYSNDTVSFEDCQNLHYVLVVTFLQMEMSHISSDSIPPGWIKISNANQIFFGIDSWSVSTDLGLP